MCKSCLRDWEVVSGNYIAPEIAYSKYKVSFLKKIRKYDSDAKMSTGVCVAEGHLLSTELSIRVTQSISLLSILLAKIHLRVVNTGFNFGVR